MDVFLPPKNKEIDEKGIYMYNLQSLEVENWQSVPHSLAADQLM